MEQVMSLRMLKAQLTVRALCAALTGLITCVAAHPATQPPTNPVVTAFVHVNVLPMDTDRVLHDQTVLVQGDEVAAIGSSVVVPTGATVIDGHGSAYLSPGLADM